MRIGKKICLGMAALAAGMFLFCGMSQNNQTFAAEEAAKVDMIFVTDVHSHYEDFATMFEQ